MPIADHTACSTIC